MTAILLLNQNLSQFHQEHGLGSIALGVHFKKYSAVIAFCAEELYKVKQVPANTNAT
jgi:hypothetical protein